MYYLARLVLELLRTISKEVFAAFNQYKASDAQGYYNVHMFNPYCTGVVHVFLFI